MKLVITEKPSVAKAISKVLGAYQKQDGYWEGSGYLVSWCLGHLVELAEPMDYDQRYRKWRMEDLPIIPDRWQYKTSNATKKQFQLLKKLMARKDVTELVEATDAGREGELIFRLVYHQAKCKKPFKRLWISSMEDSAIREGFENLRDSSEFDALYEAALSRSRADWLVGINGTRLFSKRYNRKMTVGRVQTPTLAMVADRHKQIMGFEKQQYYNVHLKQEGLDLVKEKLPSRDEAETLAENCRDRIAVITKIVEAEKNISPPRLYDLTTLQREANRYFGYTAQMTLSVVQQLYEQKLITYPRTDSKYLTEDMGETAARTAQLVKTVFQFESPGEQQEFKNILNNSKVSDHHAIIPTMQIGHMKRGDLSEPAQKILLLIAARLLIAVAPKQRMREIEITAECMREEFIAKGKNVLEPGWKAIEAELRAKAGVKPSEEDKAVPLFSQGYRLRDLESSVSEHTTSPPKAYTDDTLLSAMENAGNKEFEAETEKKGLGTPATRAGMIEKLVANKYLSRKGKNLVPTEEGLSLVELLPSEIKTPAFTASWENALLRMERGEIEAREFSDGIKALVSELVKKYRGTAEQLHFHGSGSQREQIGSCPRCGSPVFEGSKNYYCSDRNCHFCIWKEYRWLKDMGKTISKGMAASLLETGRTRAEGLFSKRKSRCFSADLVLVDTGEQVGLRLDFSQ